MLTIVLKMLSCDRDVGLISTGLLQNSHSLGSYSAIDIATYSFYAACDQYRVFSYCFCRKPEKIVLCVLPDDKCDDITMQIHFTLIEAFCLENDILVVKVGLL